MPRAEASFTAVSSWLKLNVPFVGSIVSRRITFHGLERVLKLPPDRQESLSAAGQAVPFEPMGGRRMNGWVVVDGSADWPPLVEEARAFVESQTR